MVFCKAGGFTRYALATWSWRSRVRLMDYPAPDWLLSTAGELRMPFSDTAKYCILGISVALLLLALGILAWQAFRCCTETHTTITLQDAVNRDPLYLVEKSRTVGNYSGAPRTRVAGSLHFSIYYDQLQSQLVVTVLQAEGLLGPGRTCSLEPFVKLRLMWAVSEGVEVDDCTDEEGEGSAPVLWTVLQEWRTRIVKGSCNPLFGDQFSCIMQEDKKLNHINLRMEVRHFDKFSRHTVLGEVRVPLGQLNISYPLELQEDLKTPKKDLVGEVLLTLKFLPTSQRLEVGLLKVRAVLNEICSDAALYARISLQCNQHKLRYQKTSTVAHSLVTVFNEVLMFSLPEFPLEQCKISVSVYETHTTRKSPKHLIGQLTLGKEKSSEDEHWSLMMRSVRQPIAKWHGLLI
ncbi:synaptotagmin-2 isoform X4 [Anarrhichthys ocellatus]|uniref:synaptotagmin-2 isoform X4 n=1 Tax=Anarrhichthys ocellatus TaxID=433405 RepID=UPI0012ED6233|nr:synaptotagmin-2-like isoform X4 [Anarrhichthys ocellatus]